MAVKCNKWKLVERSEDGRQAAYERLCNYGKVRAALQFDRLGRVHSVTTSVDGYKVGIKFGPGDEKSALRIAAGAATRRYGE
jgi:hypothetical protein